MARPKKLEPLTLSQEETLLALIEFQSEHGYNKNIHRLGIPDRFISHATADDVAYQATGHDDDDRVSNVDIEPSGAPLKPQIERVA